MAARPLPPPTAGSASAADGATDGVGIDAESVQHAPRVPDIASPASESRAAARLWSCWAWLLSCSPALPDFVRALFLRSFTDGLDDPVDGRLSETEWRTAMRRLRGLIRRCPVCGTEQFFDPQRRPDLPCAAPDCRAALTVPATLHARHLVVLDPGLVLYAHDIAGSGDEDFAQPSADIVRHPRTGVLAIRNLSGQPWRLLRDGQGSAIALGMAVVVRDGLQLEIAGNTARLSC